MPTPEEIERQRRMSLLDSRKSLVTGDDGYVVFWPTSNVGAYTELRTSAKSQMKLDRRNAAWDALVQSRSSHRREGMKGYRLVGVREGGPNEELYSGSSISKAIIAMALHCEEWNNLIVYAPNGALLAQLNHEGFVVHG